MDTITIAICDDEKIIQQSLRRSIAHFFADSGLPCQINCYDSGEEVLRQEKSFSPDLFFLDIQMNGKNGMEIAREFRMQNKNAILVFVTALPEYVYEAFDVNAFHYLVKPFSEEKLLEILETALQELLRRKAILEDPENKIPNREKKGLIIKRGGLSTRVLLSDIIYAEVFNRKVMLHTTNGNIEYYGKLTDLSEQVGTDFYRTHRAYLVNLRYVEKYNTTTIWLEQGTALLSKKQFSGFVRQYMQYINRQNNRQSET
ncbi:MAG: LytTR family DNA-binding domain-containing protein [Kineothrix sp.]|nr:LytTR family DNA-binding domain-containing protein [Kineothrix sp.]